jgi:hypothetical protein
MRNNSSNGNIQVFSSYACWCSLAGTKACMDCNNNPNKYVNENIIYKTINYDYNKIDYDKLAKSIIKQLSNDKKGGIETLIKDKDE